MRNSTSSYAPSTVLKVLSALAMLSSGMSVSGIASAQETVTVGASFPFIGVSPFFSTESQLVVEAAKAAGLDMLPPTDAKSDTGKQITDIQALISSGAKGLIVVPNDSKAICSAIKQAAAKGIPMVGQDMGADCPEIYVNVRTDNVAMGRIGCEYIGKELGGKGVVLNIAGDLSSQNGRDRKNGFDDCMKEKFPEIDLITQPTDWGGAAAADKLQATLVQNPDLGAIFLASDTNFLSAVSQVLKSKQKWVKRGEAGHIVIAGIDGGGPTGLQMIRDEYVDATVSQPLPDFSKYSLEYLVKAIKGEKLAEGDDGHGGKIVIQDGITQDYLPSPLVTKENVDSPELWANQQAAKKAFGSE